MPKKNSASVDEDTLRGFQQRGLTSPVLEARLAYVEAAHLINHYLKPMSESSRVYPRMCSPQASGRLSVSDPPLINFTPNPKYGPHGIQDVVVPDPGMEWACFDLDAVEARLIGHASGDTVDEEIFRRGLDIHSVTGIRMLRWPEPSFEPTKANLFGEQGQEWCAKVPVPNPPYHEKHPFRTLFKNVRYTGQYCKNEKAMGIYAIDLNMKKEQLWHFGKLYFDSKPWLVQWKRRVWQECWRTHESRTAFGRRRRLVGYRDAVEKEGLNHRIQGTVADIMKQLIRQVCYTLNCAFVQQSHDGAKFAFPRGETPLDTMKGLVERKWLLWEHALFIPATWEVIRG